MPDGRTGRFAGLEGDSACSAPQVAAPAQQVKRSRHRQSEAPRPGVRAAAVRHAAAATSDTVNRLLTTTLGDGPLCGGPVAPRDMRAARWQPVRRGGEEGDSAAAASRNSAFFSGSACRV